MKLSVIVPCYNEKDTIETIIKSIRQSVCKPLEIIVVDDGSNDGTTQCLQNLQGEVDLILTHRKNRGKGASIRTALRKVTGDIVVIQDADLEYDPAEYERLIAPILQGKADVVYGSRFMGSEPHRVLYFWHRLGNCIVTQLSNIFTNLNLTDMETCHKAFRTEVIKDIRIEENRFGFEPEITAKVARRGCRIFEVGVSYSGRTYSEGKKIGWTDGVRAIFCIIKYNLFR